MMMVREKRDIRPALLQFGVALALSLGGIFFSFLGTKRIKLSPPRPSSRQSSDGGNPGVESSGIRSDHLAFHLPLSSCSSESVTSDEIESACLTKVVTDGSLTNFSLKCKSGGDEDYFPLLEFNDLTKEVNTICYASHRKDTKLMTVSESPEECGVVTIDHEQEIRSLRTLVQGLKEREGSLEVQLLEFYGLKEQETTVKELQSLLKLTNMETKLFSIKIDSLQADNRRLEAQVADHKKVLAELEAARGNIKMLRRKLTLEAEQNKEQILILQCRVQKLQDDEHKAPATDPEMQSNLQKMKELESELEELKESNHQLNLEKSDLAHRLESAQILANSVLENQEIDRLQEEACHLRKQNEERKEEVEQLRSDRYADLEELVYLRWINACLRFELRNYRPNPGETVARDLSKTLSPKSEEKAKRLILEYATKEGAGVKEIDISDFDFDRWSSSQASDLTNSGEFGNLSVCNSSDDKTNASSNAKYLGKLMKVLRGRGERKHRRDLSSVGPSCSDPLHGNDGRNCKPAASSQGSVTRPLDLHEALYLQKTAKAGDVKDMGRVRRHSDIGSLYMYKGFDSIVEGPAVLPSGDEKKSELWKYAEALKGPHGRSPTSRRRSASYSSF